MQINTSDLAHRAADLGHAASSIATQVAGDVGDVIVDAVDRVGRAIPVTRRRRRPIGPLAVLALLAVIGAVVVRRRRHPAQDMPVDGGAHRTDHVTSNGTARLRETEARAAGLA